ncbi:MAG: Arc family DNA-binding protein [Betaproteobacteria bacterium]|nr:Arc family DNA-binding protein [Betaproteobacteria bacterium]
MTIKDIPDFLLDQVRRDAERHHRSVNKAFIHLVEQGLHGQLPTQGYDPQETARQVALWNELAGQWESNLTVEGEISAIYASRSLGREVQL